MAATLELGMNYLFLHVVLELPGLFLKNVKLPGKVEYFRPPGYEANSQSEGFSARHWGLYEP